MSELLLIVIVLVNGAEIRETVPIEACLAVHRKWRTADALGRRTIAHDKLTKTNHRVVEIRCEDGERQEVPTS